MKTLTHQRRLRRHSHSLNSTPSLYEEVTKRIADSLSKGVIPWRKPWKDALPPTNAFSKTGYRGVNHFLLSLGPFREHRWLTFHQAQTLGGRILAGEQATRIVFWKQWRIKDRSAEHGERQTRHIPLLRYFYVFNVEQCADLSVTPLTPSSVTDKERIDRAEVMVGSMPTLPLIKEEGSRACYIPSQDIVYVPPVHRFATIDNYYATLFHELAHATGHESRFNRPGIVDDVHFGSDVYSREELIAELASAFCCSTLGLNNSLQENTASYIEGWLKTLKDDPKAFIVAAGHAQRAADYIQGLTASSDA